MNSRAVLVLGAVFLTASNLSLIADTVDADADIAALYVDAAATALSDGDSERAAELTNLALDYHAGSSDALLLRSLAYTGNQQMTQQAISSAEAAIAADSWERFHSYQGTIALARLLMQVRDYESVLNVTDSLGEMPASPGVPDPWLSTIRYFHAYSLYAAGSVALANEAIETARSRYPNDTRFFHLQMLQEPFPSYRQRTELERLLTENGFADEYLVESILLYAESASSLTEQRWALDLYLSQEGHDPAVSLVVAKLDGWDAGLDLFEELDGYRRVDVMRHLFEMKGEDRPVPQGAREFTGESVIDSDRDGFAEQLFRVQGGHIAGWRIDENQDGVAEFDVQFTNGEPSSVVVGASGVPVTIHYGVYPFARLVQISHPNGEEILTVRPRAVIFRVAESIPAEGVDFSAPLSMPARLPELDFEAYRRSSQQIDWTSTAGNRSDRRYYEAGLLVRSMHDTDGDGVWDRLAVYAEDLPTAALRDIDGDGYFEVAETYDCGRLAAVVVDDNDNGIPDLYERREESGAREWDLNEDGTIDVYEFGILVDRVRRSFPFAEDRF